MLGQEKHRGSLFISYSRRDKEKVYPFAEALSAAGVEVWIDREEIDPLDDFPARIRDGLAQSYALLAWYSLEYAQSRYCQKELTAAWICARRLTRDVLSRILVVNPEDNAAHIALGDVGRQDYLTAPDDLASRAECIRSIHKGLAGLSGDFAAVGEFRPPEWYPNAQQGSARFVGRLRELWDVHTALNPVCISEHEDANIIVQLRGLGGIGKSLLATEYAKRFGAAYPGGIHWLRAHGFDPSKLADPDARERERREQIKNLALQHGVPIREGVPSSERDFREISLDLGRELASDRPYLWVVDDLPPDLDQERVFPDWCAPSANGCTLITTRSRDYEGIGSTITVDVLEPKPALELLTSERKPQTDRESQDAKDLAEDLGRDPQALDVAGVFLLRTRDFAVLRQQVTGSDTGSESDPLGGLAAGLSGQLPGGHEKSIVATLVESIRLLGEQGLSLLRLACAREFEFETHVPLRLAKDVFKRVFALEEHVAEDYLARAVNQLEMQSLATVLLGGGEFDALSCAQGDALSVPSVVRYTMQHADPARGEAPALLQKLEEAAYSVLSDEIVEEGRVKRELIAKMW